MFNLLQSWKWGQTSLVSSFYFCDPRPHSFLPIILQSAPGSEPLVSTPKRQIAQEWPASQYLNTQARPHSAEDYGKKAIITTTLVVV